MSKLRVLDLFSGIGGFSLGLERTGGFETVAFCEIEPFPRKVLAKHWPGVPCYEDVTKLTGQQLAADGIAVDVICGGFPCQDISFAGKGAGLAGARSGLFYEVARLVGELGPKFVILENVGALLSRGLDAVLGTLASLGYDAEWHCIPASAIGAPHRRDRVWIIGWPAIRRDMANASSNDAERAPNTGVASVFSEGGEGLEQGRNKETVANTTSERCAEAGKYSGPPEKRIASGCEMVADATSGGRSRQGEFVEPFNPAPLIQRQAVDAFHGRVSSIWSVEPDVGRVANGVPDRSHRLKALGNAVVPQIPELIGHAILASRKAA